VAFSRCTVSILEQVDAATAMGKDKAALPARQEMAEMRNVPPPRSGMGRGPGPHGPQGPPDPPGALMAPWAPPRGWGVV
jgi:hypothetical protein